MPNGTTWSDIDQEQKSSVALSGITWADIDKSKPAVAGPSAEDLAATKARNAQPTEYEREHASDVAAWQHPWASLAGGAAKSLLTGPTLVGKAIHQIPGVGETLAPEAGLKAEENIAQAENPLQELGKQEGETVQSAVVPWGKIVEPAVAPAARFMSENILPEVRGIPYIGRGIKAAEEAPSAAKAAIRAGTTGALLGGVERGIQTRDPLEALKGAAYGGSFGALAGMGAYGIQRAAGIPSVGAPESVVSQEPFHLAQEEGPAIGENAKQMPIEFPTLTKPESVPRGTIPSMADLQRGIEDAAGVQRNVPFREQLSFRIGKDGNVWAKTPGSNFEVSIPKGMTDPAEINSYARNKIGLQQQFQAARMPQVGRGPLGNRVNLDVRENSGARMEAPEKMPEIIPEEVGRSMGAEPLKPNVPFREQGKQTAEPMQSEKARIEAKYPDSALRQMVHANGEAMVDRVGDNPDLLRAVHDLKNPDVRQAAINGGMKMVREDGSPIMVNNRKASGDIPRQKVFEELLRRGYTPERIIEMAQPPEEAVGKPGPQGASEWRKLERKAGD